MGERKGRREGDIEKRRDLPREVWKLSSYALWRKAAARRALGFKFPKDPGCIVWETERDLTIVFLF